MRSKLNVFSTMRRIFSLRSQFVFFRQSHLGLLRVLGHIKPWTIRDRVMTSYLFFQDGGHCIAILLPVSVFVISLNWEGRSLPVYQISAK